jgi:hypothetical protein
MKMSRGYNEHRLHWYLLKWKTFIFKCNHYETVHTGPSSLSEVPDCSSGKRGKERRGRLFESPYVQVQVIKDHRS